MLKDKKILLCLTGGIAVYKCVEIARELIKAGAHVKTIMTKSAMEFITPLTFRSITKETVSSELFDTCTKIEHISLAEWADFLVIAPATANIIGKIANGIADDLLTTTVIAATCPILIVPSMNTNMYNNPILRDNIKKLQYHGYNILEPEMGDLACGSKGKGRMPDIHEIIYAIKCFLHYKPDLKNKKILITAGASIEMIDPMRYITNISSGKMGLSLARAAFLRGSSVTLIYSSITEKLPYYTINKEAITAEDMYKSLMACYKNFDIIIMCAAVADYTPATPSVKKIKKKDNMFLELKRTNDIIYELAKKKKKHQKIVGFAAESENIKKNAHEKLVRKNLDMIIGNSINVAGKNDSEVYIINKDYPTKTKHIKGDKLEIANIILDSIIFNDDNI